MFESTLVRPSVRQGRFRTKGTKLTSIEQWLAGQVAIVKVKRREDAVGGISPLFLKDDDFVTGQVMVVDGGERIS